MTNLINLNKFIGNNNVENNVMDTPRYDVELPMFLDFDVVFEDVKYPELQSKYVLNGDTGEALGIVGSKFNCSSHGQYFRKAYEAITDNMEPSDLLDAQKKWRSAQNGAWVALDMHFPRIKAEVVTTNGHTTTNCFRLVAWHAINGTASNNYVNGYLDGFCMNGCVGGAFSWIKKKNTVNWDINTFVASVRSAGKIFDEQIRKVQQAAQTPLTFEAGKNFIEQAIASERKAKKMIELMGQEMQTRGANVYALHSALTNYSTYADDRNGFNLRKTGNDTAEITMFKREIEVNGLIEQSNKLLMAA